MRLDLRNERQLDGIFLFDEVIERHAVASNQFNQGFDKTFGNNPALAVFREFDDAVNQMDGGVVHM